MENDNLNNVKSRRNIINSICTSSKHYDDSNDKIVEKLSVNVTKVKNNNAIKLLFSLKDLERSNLKKLSSSDFTIHTYDETNKDINNIFTNWNGIEICNGDTLHKIKKSFLSNYDNDSVYSIALKVIRSDIEKIKICIKYKGNTVDKAFYAIGEDGENIINLDSVLGGLRANKEKFKEILTGKCYCSGVFKNNDGLKLCLPNDKTLLDQGLRNGLIIIIEDEEGKQIDKEILTNWMGTKAVKNGMKISELKSGFLYDSSKSNTGYKNTGDPYSVSLKVISNDYKNIKIALQYLDTKIYIKYNGSDIINLGELCNSKILDKPSVDVAKVLDNLSISVTKVMYNNSIKLIFAVKELDRNSLKGIHPRNFKIYIKDENDKNIDNVFTNWSDVEVHNGDTLNNVKKSFLGGYDKDSVYSISLKPISSKINRLKICIEYNDDILNKTFYAIGENGKDVIDIKSILGGSQVDKEEVIKILNGQCYCTGVVNNNDALKLCFPNNETLIKYGLRNSLTIIIENEEGKQIDNEILTNWMGTKAVKNGMKISELKSGFLYDLSKSNTGYKNAGDPYSVSLKVISNNYKNIKIAVQYLDTKIYIKYKDNDIIKLNELCNNGAHNFNVGKAKLSDDEYKNCVQNMFEEGIICTPGAFGNTIKVIFPENEQLLDDGRRKNFKISVVDANDNNIEETIFKKWVDGEEINSGTSISEIKKLFMVNSSLYPNNKPFEFSMRYNKASKYDKIKIKITYNELSTYVSFENSDIINLNELRNQY